MVRPSFPAVVLRGQPAAGNWRQGRKRPPAALLPPLPPLRMSTESRSADTVCSAGTGYSEILNSFRKIPLSALGDFHTMIRIQLAPFYRRQQAQPHAISRNATRNISSPAGKIAAIRIPAPSAAAQMPSSVHPPPLRNIRPTPLSHSHYIRPGGKGAGRVRSQEIGVRSYGAACGGDLNASGSAGYQTFYRLSSIS